MTTKPIVRLSDLPSARDRDGYLIGYPGQLVYASGNRRLIYIGTIDGKHEFFIEEVSRANLGQISLAAAMQEVDRLNSKQEGE